ncbi:MAG: retroviral-like aspartic protease family protein [Acetobacteraceae bacterium]|jgi:hypothetical protein|nr:retroviral-like aspartic protease family protein [Acetobacteraceae bacterium]
MIHLRVRHRRRRFAPVVPILAVLSLAACGAAGPVASPARSPGCSVVTRADVPIEIANGQIALTASVNERPVRVRVATAVPSPLLLSAEVAAALRLPKIAHGPLLPGSAQTIEIVGVERLSIGGAPPRRVGAAVVTVPLAAAGQPGDGVVGWGYLGEFDVEIDPAARRLRLHAVSGCGDDFVPFTEPAFSVPLHMNPAGFPVVPIRVDGTSCLVALSTGFDTSVVSRAAALRAGVSEAQLAADPQVTSTFVSGARACPAHLFRQIEIGDHVFRDVRLQVLEAPPGQGDGALGADYLLRQRIWISAATGRVYIARRTVGAGG